MTLVHVNLLQLRKCSTRVRPVCLTPSTRSMKRGDSKNQQQDSWADPGSDASSDRTVFHFHFHFGLSFCVGGRGRSSRSPRDSSQESGAAFRSIPCYRRGSP